ncbi:hypothetical protein D3C72_1422460 [compost metagenome]
MLWNSSHRSAPQAPIRPGAPGPGAAFGGPILGDPPFVLIVIPLVTGLGTCVDVRAADVPGRGAGLIARTTRRPGLPGLGRDRPKPLDLMFRISAVNFLRFLYDCCLRPQRYWPRLFRSSMRLEASVAQAHRFAQGWHVFPPRNSREATLE